MTIDVVYADENDNEIGSGSIGNAIDNGIAVRICRIFIRNDEAKLLIQKRSDNHLSLPGRWDQSAAGHVDAGETYEQAALRELKEEMGIIGVELTELNKFYTEETDESKVKKRFNKIFMGIYNGKVTIDNDEVSDYEWIETAELERRMLQKPDSFTEGFIEAFKIYKAL